MSSVSEKYDLDYRTREEPVFASYLMKLSVLASVIAKKLYSMQHDRFVGSYFKSTRKRANVVPGIIGGSREFYYRKAGTSMQTSRGMHEC